MNNCKKAKVLCLAVFLFLRINRSTGLKFDLRIEEMVLANACQICRLEYKFQFYQHKLLWNSQPPTTVIANSLYQLLHPFLPYSITSHTLLRPLAERKENITGRGWVRQCQGRSGGSTSWGGYSLLLCSFLRVDLRAKAVASSGQGVDTTIWVRYHTTKPPWNIPPWLLLVRSRGPRFSLGAGPGLRPHFSQLPTLIPTCTIRVRGTRAHTFY